MNVREVPCGRGPGPALGPWKLWDSRCSVVQYQNNFEYFYDNFSQNFQAIHHEFKSTRWKFWTYIYEKIMNVREAHITSAKREVPGGRGPGPA